VDDLAQADALVECEGVGVLAFDGQADFRAAALLVDMQDMLFSLY
jgi:hypothetical protein